jgi:hypothetical protein
LRIGANAERTDEVPEGPQGQYLAQLSVGTDSSSVLGIW